MCGGVYDRSDTPAFALQFGNCLLFFPHAGPFVIVVAATFTIIILGDVLFGVVPFSDTTLIVH